VKRGTILLLFIIVVITLVLLAVVIPLSGIANKATGTTTSIRTMYSDSTTATICLNSSRSGQTPELNGAVVRLGVPDSNGTKWSVSWNISSNAWQGSVQKLGTKDLSVIVIDQDNDRRMGPDDRIQVRRDITGAGPSLEMALGLKFATGQQANCSFSFTRSNGSYTLVSFIDVGQGDSVLIKTADSRTILIDAGPPLAADSLVSYMHNRSVSVIDALIITHPDADHLGGAADVLQAFTVLSIYHPGVAKNTSAYRSFIQAAQKEGCPVHTAKDTHAGDYLGLTASATIEVLNIDPAADDVNDASIVLEMRTTGKSFLFTGDINSDVENKLVANHSFDLNVDVLKLAHHGSKYSTDDAFLDATSPIIGVISLGENTYGYPSKDTLARLSAHNVTVLRTDEIGTIDIVA
jgi:competence protein ComEC